MRSARVLVFVIFLVHINAKRFETRCKMVRELMRIGVPNDVFLGQYLEEDFDGILAGRCRASSGRTWVCLIEKVSNRDTRAMVVTPSGRKFYGLYQIPSRWCREGKKGGECNISCEALLDDDIRDDTACAMDIFQKEGFKYWTQWTIRCKNDNLITNEIYKCPDLLGKKPRSELFWNRMKRMISRSNADQSTIADYYGLYWIR